VEISKKAVTVNVGAEVLRTYRVPGRMSGIDAKRQR
jgi:hypothetical protein